MLAFIHQTTWHHNRYLTNAVTYPSKYMASHKIPYKFWDLSTKLCYHKRYHKCWHLSTPNYVASQQILYKCWHQSTKLHGITIQATISPSILNRTEMFQKMDLFLSSGSYSVWSGAVNLHIYTLFPRYTNQDILMTQISPSTVPIRPL